MSEEEKFEPRGTLALVFIFFTLFVLLYILNWIWLSGVWELS
jgi:hypothetical protein